MKKLMVASAAALIASAGASFAGGHEVGACLITKTETNPFFVKMKEGAQAKADELGVTLMTAAGTFDGDNESQVTAIENMVAAGAAVVLGKVTHGRRLAGQRCRLDHQIKLTNCDGVHNDA